MLVAISIDCALPLRRSQRRSLCLSFHLVRNALKYLPNAIAGKFRTFVCGLQPLDACKPCASLCIIGAQVTQLRVKQSGFVQRDFSLSEWLLLRGGPFLEMPSVEAGGTEKGTRR